MNFHVLTLFPQMILDCLSYSIIKRALDNKIFTVNTVNFRDYSLDKHKHVDDYPYGGGSGMILSPQPVYDAYLDIKSKVCKDTKVIYMSPQGEIFNQEKAYELAAEKDIVILCGHYEGIDQRVLDEIVTDEISVGDYILTGGEIAAITIIDSIVRLLPGVLASEDSHKNESLSGYLLEYPQYTRPQTFLNREVPDILLSGHHGNVDKYRREQSLKNTILKRPELLKKAILTDEDKEFLKLNFQTLKKTLGY